MISAVYPLYLLSRSLRRIVEERGGREGGGGEEKVAEAGAIPSVRYSLSIGVNEKGEKEKGGRRGRRTVPFVLQAAFPRSLKGKKKKKKEKERGKRRVPLGSTSCFRAWC